MCFPGKFVSLNVVMDLAVTIYVQMHGDKKRRQKCIVIKFNKQILLFSKNIALYAVAFSSGIRRRRRQVTHQTGYNIIAQKRVHNNSSKITHKSTNQNATYKKYTLYCTEKKCIIPEICTLRFSISPHKINFSL